MPIYVMEHGYYDEKCIVSVLDGPVGADIGALYAQWLALLGSPVVTPSWHEFFAWLVAKEGWCEHEYSTYNMEDGADNGIDGPGDIHENDRWGSNPSSTWPDIVDADPCPDQPLQSWMSIQPRHYYIAARLPDGSKIWRCRYCGKTLPAPTPPSPRDAVLHMPMYEP